MTAENCQKRVFFSNLTFRELSSPGLTPNFAQMPLKFTFFASIMPVFPRICGKLFPFNLLSFYIKKILNSSEKS